MISCEWIQIAQSTTRSFYKTKAERVPNFSNLQANQSRYKEFFNVIKNENNLEECDKNIVQNTFKQQKRNSFRCQVNNLTNLKEIKRDNHVQKIGKTNIILNTRSATSKDMTVDAKPALNTIIAFFKNGQQFFPKNVVKGIHYKINLLKNIEDKMLNTIGQFVWIIIHFVHELMNYLNQIIGRQIKVLWPVTILNPYRIRRSNSNHEMDFPSTETALMTISFLTLAVFLIKLVLVSILNYYLLFSYNFF